MSVVVRVCLWWAAAVAGRSTYHIKDRPKHGQSERPEDLGLGGDGEARHILVCRHVLEMAPLLPVLKTKALLLLLRELGLPEVNVLEA